MNTYEPVIGLEIHVELKTASGMFCGCKNDQSLDKKPNIYTCPVCLGLPGALPVPNRKAIEWTIMLGLALDSKIAEVSKFDRKHYFYPDLPKGYQISQYDMPLCNGGVVSTSFGDVRLRRIHLEEDTGTLKHSTLDGKRVSLVDFNRSGTPLVEIVTEPDIKSSEQAKEFLKKLHQIVRYLDISDADMEKGSMRIEPNISIRLVGTKELPNYKVEVKNINSFKFAAAAIEYEIKRHAALLDKGDMPAQETRGWDENKSATVSQRSKEEAADYRYFPEPDIPPMRFTGAYVESLQKQLPELPDKKKARLMDAFGLSDYDIDQLTESAIRAAYFEECVKQAKDSITPKAIANWIINKKPDPELTPSQLVALISSTLAVESISDNDVVVIIDQVLETNQKAVSDFKSGKVTVKMFLYGNILRELKGKGDKQRVMELLEDKLK